jgi:hypothetical protein
VLIRFVYLDRPTLAGFVSQLDGGLIAETNVRLVKKRSASGHITTKPFGVGAGGSTDNEHHWTMSYPPEAQFQRLLAVAYDDPDDIAWIDVVDPDNDFGGAQVGETIAWECDVDISTFSRMAARGGGGSRALELMRLFAAGGAAGFKLGGETIDPQLAAEIKTKIDVIRQLLDEMDVNRIAIGRDSETEWSIFGPLYADHLQVEDINNERVIVVGKIKSIIRRGESRKLVNTEAMRFMQSLNSNVLTAPADPDNEIAGPALELDILAIYR